MSDEKNIAAIGEVLWDVYGDKRYIGGAPANFVSHIAQTTHNAFLFSRVGDDANGRELTAKLQASKIDISGVQTDIFKPTGTVTIELDESGNPTYRCSENVAFDDMRVDSTWETLAPQMDVVFFGMLAQRNQTSREAIGSFLGKAPKALKVFDANIRRWDEANERIISASLKHADIFKLNQKECGIIKKGMFIKDDDADFLQALIQKYDLKMAALTLGNVGSYIITADQHEFDPGYYINAIDTTGAGDAFAAGLLYKYLQNADLKEISDFANRLAAFVAARKGATPTWTIEELEVEMAFSL